MGHLHHKIFVTFSPCRHYLSTKWNDEIKLFMAGEITRWRIPFPFIFLKWDRVHLVLDCTSRTALNTPYLKVLQPLSLFTEKNLKGSLFCSPQGFNWQNINSSWLKRCCSKNSPNSLTLRKMIIWSRNCPNNCGLLAMTWARWPPFYWFDIIVMGTQQTYL